MAKTSVFSENEAVEMAVQTEQNGYAFYKAAAEAAQAEEVAELMEWLAEQEQVHELTFRQMLDRAAESRPPEEYPGQKKQFAQVLLEARVLPDAETGKQAVADMTDDLEAVEFALGFEKDTILFQYEMRELVGEKHQDTVNAIIQEEKSHVRTLNEIKSKLT